MGPRTRPRRALALFFGVLIVLGGCASFTLPPLATDHPANPDAPAASDRSRSTTLAYAKSDIPSAAPAPTAAAGERAGSRPVGGGAARTVVGEGEVIATVPNQSQIVDEHGEIKGFMEPMTMGYRIDPPALLERVKPGDSVRFTIDVDRRAIIAIEKLR
jgi:Cu/Ag efflux protein CusF